MKKASLFLIIGLFLMACAHAFAQVRVTTPNNGLIKGKVTDTATPRPNNLSGVAVTVENPDLLGGEGRVTAITNISGNYEISSLPPGKYLVTTTRSKYHDRTDYVTVGSGDEVFHDVKLRKRDTLMTYFWKMGPHKWRLVFCLLALSFWAIFTVVSAIRIINRIHRLGKSKSDIGETFISRVREALRDNDVSGAISVCDEVGGLADILGSGLLRYIELTGKGQTVGEDEKEATRREAQKAVEEASAAAKKELRYPWWLFAMFGIIGGTALLYGLWATARTAVWLREWAASRSPGDVGNTSELLAGGMSEARLTTWFGLVIAVISAGLCLSAFILHIIFKRKADALISGTQQTFAEVASELRNIVDKDSASRSKGVETLIEMKDESAVLRLEKALSSSHKKSDIHEITQALIDIGTVPALISVLKYGPDALRIQAAEILIQKADSSTIPMLTDILEGYSVTTSARSVVVSVLAGIQDEAAIPALIDALWNSYTRDEAFAGLVKMGYKAIPYLEEAAKQDKRIKKIVEKIITEILNAVPREDKSTEE